MLISAILQYSQSTVNKHKANTYQIKCKLIQDYIHSLQLCNYKNCARGASEFSIMLDIFSSCRIRILLWVPILDAT